MRVEIGKRKTSKARVIKDVAKWMAFRRDTTQEGVVAEDDWAEFVRDTLEAPGGTLDAATSEEIASRSTYERKNLKIWRHWYGAAQEEKS